MWYDYGTEARKTLDEGNKDAKGAWFSARVAEMRDVPLENGDTGTQWRVEFIEDDAGANDEWMDLREEKWRLLPTNQQLPEVGDHIEIWDPPARQYNKNGAWYKAEVLRVRDDNDDDAPVIQTHFLRWIKEDAGNDDEWQNLNISKWRYLSG